MPPLPTALSISRPETSHATPDKLLYEPYQLKQRGNKTRNSIPSHTNTNTDPPKLVSGRNYHNGVRPPATPTPCTAVCNYRLHRLVKNSATKRRRELNYGALDRRRANSDSATRVTGRHFQFQLPNLTVTFPPSERRPSTCRRLSL